MNASEPLRHTLAGRVKVLFIPKVLLPYGPNPGGSWGVMTPLWAGSVRYYCNRNFQRQRAFVAPDCRKSSPPMNICNPRRVNQCIAIE
ncbi:hypothetical protein EVAR_93093_1 [Eumeta japonica]|uniref:Uncharacterized protein n=1 Tax=Eumeta variegata TaxID=151549 RepID=A0A4C1TI61_EUMVA|nr:hypothetical protein EVAR_93093_1 [Eumeta japonica]